MFRGCTYFGTLQACQIGSTQQVKSVKDVKAIEHTCEKIAQQDYESLVTLSIYQNCIEMSETYSNRVFQFFHIASLVYAKRFKKGIAYIAKERKTKRLMCTLRHLFCFWWPTVL